MLVANERNSTKSVTTAWRWRICLSALAFVGNTSCLPGFDEQPPNTEPQNVDRSALLRIIPGPGAGLGAAVPLVIEGNVERAETDVGADPLCVLLWADQGQVTFPFGSGCEADAGTDEREAIARRCIEVGATASGWVGGSAVGVYVPEPQLKRALIVGALYANADCSGEAVAEVAVDLNLSDGSGRSADGGFSDGGAPESTQPEVEVPNADVPDGGVRDVDSSDGAVSDQDVPDGGVPDQNSSVGDTQSVPTSDGVDGGSDASDVG